MHNGMVQFGEQKMAKSVGNIRLLADALDEYGRDALVLYFLSGHYRQPLAFSADSLSQAQRAVERIANFCRLLERSPEGIINLVADRMEPLRIGANTRSRDFQ